MESQIVVEPKYREFMNGNETVKEWLKRRPLNTQMCYANDILRFCEYSHLTPDEFQRMDPKTARDVAWKFIDTLMDKPSVAINVMSALKSFYRNHDGIILPFDGSKFGKHHVEPDARKAKYEHVPTKAEVYRIIDSATSLRDKAMLLTLFQSGIRENALLRLTYGMVREQLQKGTVPLHLKIDDTIDTKLHGYRLPFYHTFIGREAIEAIKLYLEIGGREYKDDSLLFQSSWRNTICATSVWMGFKRAMRRAGFDVRSMWVHVLRKAFKAELRKANVQEELSESLMGHKLKGSREAYMNRDDAINELRLAYEQADFTREGKSQEARHENEIQGLKLELVDERQKTEGVSQYLDELKTQIENLQKQLNGLQAEKSNVNTNG